ncbi:hypothetical protein [Nostoc sp.]
MTTAALVKILLLEEKAIALPHKPTCVGFIRVFYFQGFKSLAI